MTAPYGPPKKAGDTMTTTDDNRRSALDDLLILCPTGHHLEHRTEETIDLLTACGARKLRSNGVSDVTLHRCRVATRAGRMLLDDPTLQHVLWIDGDMVIPFGVVQRLIALSDTMPAASFSAGYCKRGSQKEFAAVRVKGEPTLTLPNVCTPGERCLPALVGMGCLMTSRDSFLAHLDEAQVLGDPAADVPKFSSIRAATASGPGRSSYDPWLAWGSEDWTWCSWEWQHGRPVYLCPYLLVGHISEMVLWPDSGTVCIVQAGAGEDTFPERDPDWSST